MAISSSTILADLQIQHQLQIQRLATHEAQKVQVILRQLAEELAKQTILIDPTAPMRVRYRTERTKKLMDGGRRLIGEKFTEILKAFQGDMYDLAKIEAQFGVDALNKATGMSLIVGSTLTANQMRSVVNSTYIEGGLLRDWFSRASEGYTLAFQREIRAGMMAGEGIDKMVRRLIGGKREFPGYRSLYDKQRRGTEALVRTSTMSISNESRMAAFRENEDVIKGYIWMATLDSDTCEVCAALDGKMWDLEHNPVGHDFEYRDAPSHWSCRCVLTVALKSWEELGIGANRISESTRASMDGQVPKSLSFGDWFAGKSEKFKLEYLGRGRYELYREGKITFEDLITQKGRPLTLAELRKVA